MVVGLLLEKGVKGFLPQLQWLSACVGFSRSITHEILLHLKLKVSQINFASTIGSKIETMKNEC
jgi:hypothetical protein